MDALGRRDLPCVIALTDPEVEWHSFFAELGDDGVYRGHDGIRQYLSDLDDAWEILRADVDEGVGVGDVAVLLGRIHYRGRISGIETEAPAGWMLKFRDGRAVCIRAFREPEQALETLGLTGQARAADLDLVTSIYTIFSASNRRDLDAVVTHYAPDAVWDMSAMGLGTFNGRAEIRQHLEAWFAPYEEFAFKVEQVSDLGHGVVLGVVHEQARMRGGSGVIPRHVAFVWEFRDDLIVRTAPYPDLDEARAVGERLAQERE
jgi:ketosteroid isomerase-like protein